MSKKSVCLVVTVAMLALAGSALAQAGPTGWWAEHIGTDVDGSATVKGNTIEITGDGADIWNNADDFQFMYKKLTGDGTVVARVVSVGTGSNTWAKGGVMVRQDNSAGSTDAYMVITSNSDGAAGNGSSFQWRPTAGGGCSNTDSSSVVAPPYWVKIDRVGATLNGSYSPDGTTWTQVGTTSISMTDPILIGLCVTSHAAGELRTMTFDNVSFTGDVMDRPPQTKAMDPDPASGTVGVNTPLFAWTPGETALFHNVYFGTTPELTDADLMATNQPFAMYFHIPGLESGTTYYWRVDEVDPTGNVTEGDVWTFTSEPIKDYAPTPADGATGQLPGVMLSWKLGKEALQHHVYFGMDTAAVAAGDASVDQGTVEEASFNTGALRASTTYYWRVDAVKLDGSIEQGDVWSFTTADAGPANKIKYEQWLNIGGGTAISDLTGNARYPDDPDVIEYWDSWQSAVDTADNYGDRAYGWLKPPESGDYTFWIAGDDFCELWLSDDGSPTNAVQIANVPGWTPALDFDNTGGGSGGASQKSAPITLQAGQKYFIMSLHKEGGGGDSVSVAWQGPGIDTRQVIAGKYVDQFNLPPLQAFGAQPADGAVDTAQSLTLSWNAGEKAQEHEVYLGDDKDAVMAADNTSPLFMGSQAGTTYDTGDLEWGKTYYWRVDEINTGEASSPWKGKVWSFTTAEFIPVDDMESYTDEEGSRIYETWIDGWTNGTGSVVGNLVAPFAEQTIVHSGKQSLPLDYNNANSPYYSEAELDLAPTQDWTTNDVNALSLWVRGNPVNFVDLGNGAFTVGASGHDIWDNADDFRFIYKRLNGDGSVVVKVDSLANSNGWAKAGVMIRDNLMAGSQMAYMIQSVANGVSFGWRQTPDGTCGSSTVGGVTAPQWVKLTRTGNAFTAQYSADGTTWTDITDATTGAPVSTTIMMNSNIYIGLCVTSHDSALTTTAELSGAATTGGVSGSWQQAWIGDDPDLTNGAASLYVAVEDSTGKVAVASDPTLANAASWTEWKIPLSDLAGINLARVQALYIGVGDRDNPVPDGSGRVYIDDIRVTK